MGALGDRMKRYEQSFNHVAVRRSPLVVRVDGRAFHAFTRGLEKPFDSGLMQAMVDAAKVVARDMQGFKLAYVQSDEVTFALTDYDTHETEGWFNYEINKVVSISASLMSVAFNNFFPTNKMPVFDSRAFTVPVGDVVNLFLWRAKDWQRNSVAMYAQSVFSHKQLHGKKQPDMHEMLYGVGKNWVTDLSEREKNGTFVLRVGGDMVERADVLPSYESIDSEFGALFREGQ